MSSFLSGRLLLAAPVVAAAVLAAGCGGDGSKSNDTSSPDEWADSFCSAIGTWADSLTGAVRSISGANLSEDTLKSAASDANDANKKLQEDLQDLGKPDTAGGQQAKKSIDQLSKELDTGMNKIDSTAQGVSGPQDVPGALSIVSSTLVTMGTELQTTLREIRNADAKGELNGAIAGSSSCTSLRKQQG